MSQQLLSEEMVSSCGDADTNSTKVAGTCSTCGQPSSQGNSALPSSFVYGIGKIEARFPSQSIEKEFAQIVGRTETKGLTDRQTIHKVLSERENRYIARQICCHRVTS